MRVNTNLNQNHILITAPLKYLQSRQLRTIAKNPEKSLILANRTLNILSNISKDFYLNPVFVRYIDIAHAVC